MKSTKKRMKIFRILLTMTLGIFLFGCQKNEVSDLENLNDSVDIIDTIPPKAIENIEIADTNDINEMDEYEVVEDEKIDEENLEEKYTQDELTKEEINEEHIKDVIENGGADPYQVAVDTEKSSFSMVGLWQVISIEVEYVEMLEDDLRYQFNDDGKGFVFVNDSEHAMNWMFEDDILSLGDEYTVVQWKLIEISTEDKTIAYFSTDQLTSDGTTTLSIIQLEKIS
jgi:hypothetical protein